MAYPRFLLNLDLNEIARLIYILLLDRPWLLPAAWIHRLLKTRGTLGRHAAEAQQILSADPEEIRHLQSVIRSIGL